MQAGDPVWCRTAFDGWVPMVALDEPRYDAGRAFEVVWLSVPVCKEEDVGRHNYGARSPRHTWPLPNHHWLNWHAAYVRPRHPRENRRRGRRSRRLAVSAGRRTVVAQSGFRPTFSGCAGGAELDLTMTKAVPVSWLGVMVTAGSPPGSGLASRACGRSPSSAGRRPAVREALGRSATRSRGR